MQISKLFFFLLFSFSSICIAQNNDFIFELKHHPKSEYLSELEKITNFKVKKKADKETLKYFDSLGIKRLQKGNKKETYSISTKTKELKENKTIPVEFSAYNLNFQGALNKVKVDETYDIKLIQAKGYVNLENDLTINEILIDNERSDRENELIEKLKNRVIGIDFPEHKIGIGETISFKHTIYYSALPEGNNFYNVNCIAKLVKVKRGLAYFKISSDQKSKL
ncbi:hypothetical protein [Hyunsoonleella ulvae]|uniref:hypothetical protein n=1 Tax=Hyunsoonleella ulvae TaxID=2799948 RepID=UPI00193A6D2C|nr:hypothetical protein [Hyunsoonleella ulvae]